MADRLNIPNMAWVAALNLQDSKCMVWRCSREKISKRSKSKRFLFQVCIGRQHGQLVEYTTKSAISSLIHSLKWQIKNLNKLVRSKKVLLTKKTVSITVALASVTIDSILFNPFLFFFIFLGFLYFIFLYSIKS